MATYAIGDIHGRMAVLEKLLAEIRFSEDDKIWLVGDLVNVGPRSVEVLRWASSLGDRVVVTLGNHDLHMLAVAYGVRKARKKDTFTDVLQAPDRQDLLTWLLHQKVVHREHGYLMVHAGLLPQWSARKALRCGHEVQEALRTNPLELFENMYGNEPDRWFEYHRGYDRLRVIINACTRSRALHPDGSMEFDFKGELHQLPDGLKPWFELYDDPDETVLFGHWSALGLRRTDRYVALDSGCAWSRHLTALRLDDGAIFQVSAH